MRLKYLIAAAFVVAAMLSLRWEWSRPPEFEDAVTRALLAEKIRQDGSRCPLSPEAIDRAEEWVLAACAEGGLGWYDAAQKYGDDAEKVYLTYGQDADFADVFERLGPPVIPVVAYFVKNGSTQYYLQDAVGQGLARLWGGGADARDAGLTPAQYGLIGIEELKQRGHEMLSEFEIVNGVAVRKQFTRTVLVAKNLAFGGISDLEQVIARGERLPSWSEIGWASFDAVVLAGGVGIAAKALRVAKAPAAVAGKAAGATRFRTLASAGRGAIRSLATVGKTAGVATVLAIPYIAITRPHLLTGAVAWVAEQAGMPGWLGAFLVYLAFSVVLALTLRIVLRPFVWTLGVLGRLGSWLAVGGMPRHRALAYRNSGASAVSRPATLGDGALSRS